MNPERKSELQRLAEMSVGDIGHNENNVKYRFIIPFLESFGYNKNLDFEHFAQGNRIDILIDRVSYHTILIEAKSYGKNMDDYIPQLKRYCDEKRPILAIISNGEEIRFYSPFWRKPDFTETLIFSIARHQLKDDGTIEKIERFLGKQFLEKDEDGRIRIVEHIEERENEIDNIKEEIQCLSSTYQVKIEKLATHIRNLEEQYESIQSKIDANKAEIGDLKQEKRQKIQDLKKKYFVFFSQSKPTANTRSGTTKTKRPLGRKGHEKFRDYLIPVIKLMKNDMSHTDAFKQRVQELGDVTYQTVSAQCTLTNGISTNKFIELVESNKIKSFLKERYPNKASLIEQEL